MFRSTIERNITEKGQSLIEYLLILALLVVLSAVGLHLTGVETIDLFNRIGAVFGVSADQNPGESTSEPTDNPNVVYAIDDFSDLDDWKKITGPQCWKIVGGVLSVAKNTCTSVLMYEPSIPDDYTYTMNTAQLVSGNGYGLMFRLADENSSFSGYSFQVDPGYSNQLIFRRFDRGSELAVPLASTNFPDGFDATVPHQVSVNVVGDTFTAFIDGAQVLTATDSTYTSGTTGLRIWDSSQASFDDFRVSSP